MFAVCTGLVSFFIPLCVSAPVDDVVADGRFVFFLYIFAAFKAAVFFFRRPLYFAAVRADVGKTDHQAVGRFNGFDGFERTCPQGVVFAVFAFVGAGCRGNQQFSAVAVNGEIFELGLRFEAFGVVEVQFGAAVDGAEDIDGNEYVGIGVGTRNNFHAAQIEDGLDQVVEKGGIARVGGEGFVAVFAKAVDGNACRTAVADTACLAARACGSVEDGDGIRLPGEAGRCGGGGSADGGVGVVADVFGSGGVFSVYQRTEGIASAADGTRTLIAHDGNIDGGFASLQGGQIHVFHCRTCGGGDEFLLDGKPFAAAVGGNAGKRAAGRKEQGEGGCKQEIKAYIFLLFCLVDYWLKIVFPFRAANFIL